MEITVKKSRVEGSINIPGSKSHTIRSLFIASLASGKSIIKNPLISLDTMSAMDTCRLLGADIKIWGDEILVESKGSKLITPDDIINTGNSGSTIIFGLAVSSLCSGWTVYTGDEQIRKRPLGPLINSLTELGAKCVSTKNDNSAPVIIKGTATGGKTSLDAVTSQYLSALLIAAPLYENDTTITITRLNEAPYVDMTMRWLDRQWIEYENINYDQFNIKGGQKYCAFEASIPGDFSSATFFAVLSAISGNSIKMNNLDINDTQGDKRVIDILEDMGATVIRDNDYITIEGGELEGRNIDMNDIPDALPAMAVAGCFAKGETRLFNVPQARLKETDRISVMCNELTKLGADISEISDGLIIKKSTLRGNKVCGMGDHRVVMALTIAGLNIQGDTVIDTAECAEVTFPGFFDIIRNLGGKLEE